MNTRSRLIVIFLLGLCFAAVVYRRTNTIEIQAMDPQATYDLLTAQMVKDFDGSRFEVMSTYDHVYEHPNYAKLIALGRPAVPIAIKSLQAKRPYAREILDGLLPEVSRQMGELYGDNDWKVYSSKREEYWLRWWREYGCKEHWGS